MCIYKDTNIFLLYTFSPVINLSFVTNFSLHLIVIFHCLTLQVPFAKELGNSPSITTSFLDAINDVIYHESTTHGLITSPETKTNSQSRLQTFHALEKSRRIRHRHSDYMTTIYISFNEDRCVPRTKESSLMSAITQLKRVNNPVKLN